MEHTHSISLLLERRKKINEACKKQGHNLFLAKETEKRIAERELYMKLIRSRNIYDTAIVLLYGFPATTNPHVVGSEIKAVLRALQEEYSELKTPEKKAKLATLSGEFESLEKGRVFQSLDEVQEFATSFVLTLLSK